MKQFIRLLNKAIQSGADVQKTWRKYGWIPPTEYREDYDFGKNKGVSND